MRKHLVALLALTLLGCGTARLDISPEAPYVATSQNVAPVGVSVDFDDALSRLSPGRVINGTAMGSGYDRIELSFDLGRALVESVENTLQSHFQRVERAAKCGDGDAIHFAASLATPPHLEARWVQRSSTEGGGTFAGFSVYLRAYDCEGTLLWQTSASGYASRYDLQNDVLYVEPTAAQFQAGIDQALAKLVVDLESKITLALERNLAQLAYPSSATEER